MYPSCNRMKLSKNVISGCHGYHFIELSRAILAFLVVLLGNNLRHGVDFFGPFVMMGVVMVHLHITTVNVIMLFFHIYNNESVENKHYFWPLISL